MKKVLMVELEHEEKLPDGFNVELTDFLQKLYTLGYNVVQKWAVDQLATAKPETMRFSDTPNRHAELGGVTVTHAEPVEAEVVALAEETATAVDGPEDVLGEVAFAQVVPLDKLKDGWEAGVVVGEYKGRKVRAIQAKKAAKPKVKKAKK